MKRSIRLALRALPWLALLAAAPPQVAHAHIDMLGELQSRDGDQKVAPCEGQPRGAGTVYMFEPGATITIGVSEAVAHDGYFRVAFDDDGEDDFVDPMSIDPINPNRYGTGQKCEGTAADRCGESDFCSFVSTDGGPTVLWDNLDPHIPSGIFSGGQFTWTIKLPDVECENCTLQVMQVMEDPPGHGPFDGQNDLYYRCVDIILRAGVGSTPGTTTAPAMNEGIECAATQTPDAGTPTPDGGTMTTPDAGVSGGAGGTAGEPPGQPVTGGVSAAGTAAMPPSTSAGTGAGAAGTVGGGPGTMTAGAAAPGTVTNPATSGSSGGSSGGCRAAARGATLPGQFASYVVLGLVLVARLGRRRSARYG